MANQSKKSIAKQRQEAEARKKKITIIVSVVVGVLVLAGIIAGVTSCIKNDRSNIKIEYVEADPNLTYYADIDIKGHGVITVKLDQKAAPITVSNFISLAQSGFYDGLTFHRVITDFMMQGGCPNGDGYDDAGKDIKGEFKANGHDNPISHERGVISMARGEEYNSGSSQFFIVHETSTRLDGDYAAFGKVTEGMDIVDDICENTPYGYNGAVEKENQPVIKSIKIRTE